MQVSASTLNAGLSALQSGQRRVEQASGDIVGNMVVAPPQNQVGVAPPAGADNRPDLTQSLVTLRVGLHEAQAGARLVQSADEVLGTLIDTTA